MTMYSHDATMAPKVYGKYMKEDFSEFETGRTQGFIKAGGGYLVGSFDKNMGTYLWQETYNAGEDSGILLTISRYPKDSASVERPFDVTLTMSLSNLSHLNLNTPYHGSMGESAF